MLRAATTLQSQPPRHSGTGAPLPPAGREATKGAVTPVPKVAPLPAQIFTHFKTLAMACVNFTITTPIGLTGAFRPVLGRKTNMPPDPFRFGGFPHTCHCHGYAFPCKRWLASHRASTAFTMAAAVLWAPAPTDSLIDGGADGQPIPSWGFIQKTVQRLKERHC